MIMMLVGSNCLSILVASISMMLMHDLRRPETRRCRVVS